MYLDRIEWVVELVGSLANQLTRLVANQVVNPETRQTRLIKGPSNTSSGLSVLLSESAFQNTSSHGMLTPPQRASHSSIPVLFSYALSIPSHCLIQVNVTTDRQVLATGIITKQDSSKHRLPHSYPAAHSLTGWIPLHNPTLAVRPMNRRSLVFSELHWPLRAQCIFHEWQAGSKLSRLT